MRVFAFLIIVFAAFFESGCSSKTYISDDLEKAPGVKVPVYDDLSIEDTFNKAPNLPKPFRMAIYFKSSNDQGVKTWRWKQDDQVRIINSLRGSVPKDIVSSMFMMDEALVEKETLHGIRLAAAQYKADAVLIVDGISDVEHSINKWALSYALVVPALFVKGNTLNSLFKIRANLWDVRNSGLYFTTRAEGEITKVYSLPWRKSDRSYVEQTKQMAIADFEKEMKEAFLR